MYFHGLRIDQYLLLVCLIGLGLFVPISTFRVNADLSTSQLDPFVLKNTSLNSPEILLPFKKNPPIENPVLTAKSALILDSVSGEVLFAKNEQIPLPPASLTKLMTALIAFEQYNLNDVVTIDGEELTEGNRIKLVRGEQITVLDLLRGLLIFSGNDAAMALANHHPGGYDAFITAMNNKALELQMDATSYHNPSGLDHPIQLSSAHNIAVLMRAVLTKNALKEILEVQTYQVKSIDQQYIHTLYTTNQLLGKSPSVIAGKTGSTFLAGECFVTLMEYEGHPLIIVVLGSEDRFNETQTLFDWAASQYEWKQVQYISSTSTDLE